MRRRWGQHGSATGVAGLLFLLSIAAAAAFHVPLTSPLTASQPSRHVMRGVAGDGPPGDGEDEDDGFLTTPAEVARRRQAKLRKLQDSKKRSAADLALDDFLGKRYGKGKVFYGQRLSELDATTLDAMATEATAAEMVLADADMKPNAVLVCGATGGTGQWVVLNLLAKGFNCRLFARNLDKAEELFGPDGATVDIVLGDVRDKEALTEAAAGCQAAIYCAGSRDVLGGNSFKQVDGDGVRNFVEACQAAGTVKKIVLQSSTGVGAYAQGQGVAGFGGGGGLGVLANKLLGDPLTAKARGEAAVRESGIPYVIVRPAGLRDEAGGKRRIIVGQGDCFGMAGISRMDAAEAISEALVADVANVTFEIRNSNDEEDARTGAAGRPRRGSYMETDPEAMVAKTEMEVEEVENFWLSQFEQLDLDLS